MTVMIGPEFRVGEKIVYTSPTGNKHTGEIIEWSIEHMNGNPMVVYLVKLDDNTYIKCLRTELEHLK